MNSDDLKNMTPQEILELQKKNCIFCKIIAKEIPSSEIFSDSKVLVIMDINPANEGHCLIIPKTHYQILPQIPEDVIAHMFKVAKDTSRVLLKALGVKGTSIFVANGAIAGQKAPHFMIHVIPRKTGDLLFQLPKAKVDEEELKQMRKTLAIYLGYEKEEPRQLEHHDEKSDVQIKADNEKESMPAKHSDMAEMHNTKIAEPKDEDEQKKETSIDDIANLFLGK
jgi:histidine triad (HIT) family protein